jgi:hypothetical protein
LACVLKRLWYWSNNNHYLVMYSDLFSGLSLLTVWNLWKDTGCVLLMPEHLCVWETPSWLLAYTFYLFSLTEVRLRICMSNVCFGSCPSVQTNLCVAMFFFGDSDDWFRRALISSYRPMVVYFWFSAELVFPTYFILFQLKYFLPCD